MVDSEDKQLACEALVLLCKKDWLGRPKFSALRRLGIRVPSETAIRRAVMDEQFLAAPFAIDAEDVKAVIKVICRVAGVVCPLVK